MHAPRGMLVLTAHVAGGHTNNAPMAPFLPAAPIAGVPRGAAAEQECEEEHFLLAVEEAALLRLEPSTSTSNAFNVPPIAAVLAPSKWHQSALEVQPLPPLITQLQGNQE